MACELASSCECHRVELAFCHHGRDSVAEETLGFPHCDRYVTGHIPVSYLELGDPHPEVVLYLYVALYIARASDVY